MRRVCLAVLVLAAVGCKLDSPVIPDGGNAGVWRTSTPLPFERFEGYAATAQNKIFFLGGITGVFGDERTVHELDDVVVYDPVADKWTDGPKLPADGPKHHLAVAVDADRIFVVGGFTGTIGADPTQTFHPNPHAYVLEGGATGTWRQIADPPLARGAATAQAIDGKIWVVGGGDDEKKARDELAVYDPALNTWELKAKMPTPRQHLASCAIDHKLIAVGGWLTDGQQTVSAAQIYDPATDAWGYLPDMPTDRGGLGAVTFADKCWVVGGERWHDELPDTFPDMEVYDYAGKAWSAAPPMPTSRHGIGVTVLGGRIWVAGGGPVRGNSYTAVVEVFTP